MNYMKNKLLGTLLSLVVLGLVYMSYLLVGDLGLFLTGGVVLFRIFLYVVFKEWEERR